jgi:uridylate kinase
MNDVHVKKRVLLKLSGESFCDNSSNISDARLLRTAKEIKSAIFCDEIQLAVVVGGGNIWRGAGKFIDRVTSDNMGMLATVINSLALNDALIKIGIKSNVFSAFGVSNFIDDFDSEKVISSINNGNVVIFAGGTGAPFCTTDTAAALRAKEIKANMLLKATQVDGVYNIDPKKNKNAVKFNSLTFKEALDKQLGVIDNNVFLMCMHTDISITVFNFYEDGNLKKVLNGEKIGTIMEA